MLWVKGNILKTSFLGTRNGLRAPRAISCAAGHGTQPAWIVQLELGIPTKPPQTINAQSWISNFRLRERGTWKHGHSCYSGSVKTHLSQKMLWTRCFWARAPLGPGAVVGWLCFYTELLRLWEFLTIVIVAGFKFSNAEHQWEFVLEASDEAGWEHRCMSAVRVLITATFLPCFRNLLLEVHLSHAAAF